MSPPARRPVIAIALAVAAVAAVAVGVVATRPATTTSTPAVSSPTGTTPNIVFILTDDQTFESVADTSLNAMPYLNGRSDWIRFTSAFQEVSLCCPSRASILSGQYSSHTKVEDNSSGGQLDETQTLATWLHSAGYTTGLIGKYLNAYPFNRSDYVPPGWDDWKVFTGDNESVRDVGYFNYALNENGKVVSYGKAPEDYATDVEARQSVDFISAATGPFFLEIAPKAPHAPWTPPPRYADLQLEVPHSPAFNEADVSDKPAWISQRALINPVTQDAHRLDAYRTLRGVDDLVHSVFDALDAKGVLDNTIVVFMTDNGFAFGEHRWNTKRCPYDECMRSPMLVRYPGQPSREVDALVQNVDMAATFAAIAGVSPAIPQDGINLVPLITGEVSSVRDALLLRWAGGDATGGGSAAKEGFVPAYWGVRTTTAKYVEYDDGDRELYDLTSDPYELVNRAGDPALASLQRDLATRLGQLRAAAG